MATGVLVVGINKATRLLTYIVGTSKTYTATIRLGQSTITDDAEGDVIAAASAAAVTDEAIHDGVAALTGLIQQVPSSVSAIKVNGERAYARVRSGEEVKLAARPVTIHRFEVHGINREAGTDTEDAAVLDIDVTVECSSGTYIRALARDLGERAGSRRPPDGSTPDPCGALLAGAGADLGAVGRGPPGPGNVAGRARPDAQPGAHRRGNHRDLLRPQDRGRRGSRSPGAATADHPAAAFAPDGSLVALLADSGNFAKPVLVFAPGNGARES